MAERVVRVKLSAVVEDYKRGMLEAAQATRTVGTEAEKLAQTRQAMQTVGTAAVGFGASVAAGIGVAVGKFAEFDQAMSFVAATGDDARANMDALRQAALDAGAETVFSATESANAIEEMAKAGLSAADILGGGLTGALDLAAAGGLGVADAAGIAATALKVFNLEGSDMSHVADLLAAGAGKAMGDVSDLSAALAQGGQVAAATGLSIEETTATLASFASQGLLGSDAGTSFKTMLQRLTPQSKEASDKMAELGISAYDASGNFIGMAEFAGNLQESLRDLTPEQRNAALAVMFGSDAVRAANVVYSEGEDGIRKWIDAVDDQGYAAETAATRLDNLIGDWEAFTGALDTAFISMGEGANGPLRWLVQGLTDLVDGFNDLPDWAKQVGVGVAALAAGVGLVGGAALLAIPQIAAFKVALIELGLSASRTDRLMGLLGRAAGVAGVVGVFALAATAANELGQALADAIGPSAEEVASKIALAKTGVDLFYAGLQKRDAPVSSIKAAADLFGQVGDALNDAADQADEWWNAISFQNRDTLSTIYTVGEELQALAKTDFSAAADQFRVFAEDADLSKRQIIQLMREMPGFRDEIVKAAAAAGVAADDQSLFNYVMSETADAAAVGAGGIAEIEEAASDADDALMAAVSALEAVARGALDLGDAKDSALSALNAMRDAAEAEGATLDGTNDASIRFRDSIREVEDAHRASAEAIIQNGGTLDEANASWAAGRQAVIDMMVAKGMDIDQAHAWADANLGSAGEVQTALGDVKRAVDNVPATKNVNLTVSGTAGVYDELMRVQGALRSVTGNHSLRVATGPGGQGGLTFATGGRVVGPGTGTSDSIPAWLSDGEHVIPADEVQAAGGHEAIERYRRMISGGSRVDERTISGTWVNSGSQFGFQQSQPAPSLSLEGMSITGTLDLGNGLTGFVDGRIVQAQTATFAPFSGGRR